MDYMTESWVDHMNTLGFTIGNRVRIVHPEFLESLRFPYDGTTIARAGEQRTTEHDAIDRLVICS